MQVSVFGASNCVILCLVVALWLSRPAAAAQESQSSAAAGNLISHVSAVDGQPIVVTVIDVGQHALAVYFIDRQSGEITLRSVRNFTWDLQMKDFNTGKPLPQDIRNGLPK